MDIIIQSSLKDKGLAEDYLAALTKTYIIKKTKTYKIIAFVLSIMLLSAYIVGYIFTSFVQDNHTLLFVLSAALCFGIYGYYEYRLSQMDELHALESQSANLETFVCMHSIYGVEYGPAEIAVNGKKQYIGLVAKLNGIEEYVAANLDDYIVQFVVVDEDINQIIIDTEDEIITVINGDENVSLNNVEIVGDIGSELFEDLIEYEEEQYE